MSLAIGPARTSGPPSDSSSPAFGCVRLPRPGCWIEIRRIAVELERRSCNRSRPGLSWPVRQADAPWRRCLLRRRPASGRFAQLLLGRRIRLGRGRWSRRGNDRGRRWNRRRRKRRRLTSNRRGLRRDRRRRGCTAPWERQLPPLKQRAGAAVASGAAGATGAVTGVGAGGTGGG